MDKFSQSEQIGRTLLKSFLDQYGAINQQPTTDKYNPVDYYFEYKGQKVVAEIKCRDIRYMNYSTHIIEETKLKNLLQAKKDGNCNYAYYINFFGDYVYWYNTGKIIKNATIHNLYCNRTTAEYNGKTDKLIREIPTGLAMKFVKTDGKWSRMS